MVKSGEMTEEHLLNMLDKHCNSVTDRLLFDFLSEEKLGFKK
jgi:hypothetical protein